MNPDELQNNTFSVVLRGYDRAEVDSALARAASRLRELRGTLASLREQLDDARAELAAADEGRTSTPAPAPAPVAVADEPVAVQDPIAAYQALGERTTQILVQAEEAANVTRQEAAAHAERVRSKADEHAELVRTRADDHARRVRADADDHAQRVQAEAEQWAQERTTAARQAAEDMTNRAREQASEELRAADAKARAQLDDATREGERVIDEALAEREGVRAEIEALASTRDDLALRLQVAVTSAVDATAALGHQLQAAPSRGTATPSVADDASDDEVRLAAAAGAPAGAGEAELPDDELRAVHVHADDTSGALPDGDEIDDDGDDPLDGQSSVAAAAASAGTAAGHDDDLTDALEDAEAAAFDSEAAALDALAASVDADDGIDGDARHDADGVDADDSDDSDDSDDASAIAAVPALDDADDDAAVDATTAADDADADDSDDADGAAAAEDAVRHRAATLDEHRPGLLSDLRRGLQDIQSSVLAGLRDADGEPDLDAVLPDGHEAGPLQELAAGPLLTLDRAARDDAAALVGLDEATPVDDDEVPQRVAITAADLADGLLDTLHATLRPSLEAGVSADEPTASLSERVGEVFRDLRGPVVTGLVDRSMLRLYGAAVTSEWGEVGLAEVAWVLGEETRCPEGQCRGNADESPVAVGEPFPSGHEVPPAHEGCTCVLTPVRSSVPAAV